MFDYIFRRIIDETNIDMLNAIHEVIKDTELSDKEKAQLQIVCQMQKQIQLLTEIKDLERQKAEGYKELASNGGELVKKMYDALKANVIKVTVAPIEGEE